MHGISEITVDNDKPGVMISALKGLGINNLLDLLEKELIHYTVKMSVSIPYTKPDLIRLINSQANILKKTFTETGVYMEVEIGKKFSSKLREYAIT